MFSVWLLSYKLQIYYNNYQKDKSSVYSMTAWPKEKDIAIIACVITLFKYCLFLYIKYGYIFQNEIVQIKGRIFFDKSFKK